MRMLRIPNRKHPYYVGIDVWNRTKRAMSCKSNRELDAFITDNIADPEARAAVLALPRGKRIRHIADCAKRQFFDNLRVEEKEALAPKPTSGLSIATLKKYSRSPKMERDEKNRAAYMHVGNCDHLCGNGCNGEKGFAIAADVRKFVELYGADTSA